MNRRSLDTRLVKIRMGCWLALLLVSVECQANQPLSAVAASEVVTATNNREKTMMWMTAGEQRFSISLEDNEASRALSALLPLTLDMIELHGNEKYASLPQQLPVDSKQVGMIRRGDVLLYGDDTLVVFYETFKSSYAYTRLGRIEDVSGLTQSLGRGDVQVTFTAD